MVKRWSVCAAAVLLAAASAKAEWDPDNGVWGKTEETDVRVMTWNTYSQINSGQIKQEGYNQWCALTRIVAAMKPDVLLIQEGGDSDGVGNLETTFDLFLHGGFDPFNGENVTSWVQKYAPSYDLPYVYVSTYTDGYNRDVILSRFPFADLNGDTKSRIPDIPTVLADEYAPGGNGGIRGFQLAEFDLPDDDYVGDLVIGNVHLKAGTTTQDKADRLRASQNVAYVIDYWFNGAGTGVPDPHGKIFDSPAATTILDDDTPVVIGGDWNEDELTNGRKGPADWFTMAELTGPPDGTDRDRGDMTYDSAVHWFTGSRATKGSAKFDYLAWQDSIATLRRAWVFNTAGTPSAAMPPEIDEIEGGYPSPFGASGAASDHLPVLADLILPEPSGPLGDLDGDGDVDLDDFALFGQCFGGADNPPAGGCQPGVDADLDDDGDVDLNDFAIFGENFTGAQ